MISAPSCKEQVLARCADGLIYYEPLYDHVAAWGQAPSDHIFPDNTTRRRNTHEVAIDECNVFHVHPAAIKSKEEVKEFFNLLAVYIADSQKSRM